MSSCAHCPHHDYAHEDVRLGAACLVEYGVLGDSAFMEFGSDERCLCPGFEPEVIG